jgi:hypothetical protein
VKCHMPRASLLLYPSVLALLYRPRSSLCQDGQAEISHAVI